MQDSHSPATPRLVERVLSRLAQLETREIDPWFQDDYRQTWITLSTLHRGKFQNFWDAFVAASYNMYGLHPDRLSLAIENRRRWHGVVEFVLPPKKRPHSLKNRNAAKSWNSLQR